MLDRVPGRRPRSRPRRPATPASQASGRQSAALGGKFEPYELPILNAHPYQPTGQRNADCQGGQFGYALGGGRCPARPLDNPAYGVSDLPGSRGPTTLFTNDAGERELQDTRNAVAPARDLGGGRPMRREHSRRLPSWLIGLVLVIVLAIASLLAFTKQLPWGDAYEVKAVFASAQNLRPSSPVRIAGVDVGKVTEVEHADQRRDRGAARRRRATRQPRPTTDEPAGEQAAVVTMELTEDALPLHSDAHLQAAPAAVPRGQLLRRPGARAARTPPEIDDGHTFPVNQTAYSVQLDQVLTTLQGDVRADLQMFLDQFGNALIKHGGAEGFRELYRTSPPSDKFTSQVNEAFLGTEPGDLSGLIRASTGSSAGSAATSRRCRTWSPTSASSPARSRPRTSRSGGRSRSCRTRSRRRGPAFANLNASFPALRAFAREALPGHALDPGDAARGDPVRRPGPRAGLRARAARPGRRPAADDPAARASSRSARVTFLEQARALVVAASTRS